MSQTLQKWVLGILSALIVSTIIGGVAWAQTVRSDISVLQSRTEGLSSMQATLEEIRVDVAAIRARSESRDRELDRRLERLESGHR
jgi:hypothetical protein